MWYVADELRNNPEIKSLVSGLLGMDLWLMYLFFIGILLAAVTVVISLKLIFLAQLHSVLHKEQICMLCQRGQDKTLWQILLDNKFVLWRSVLASIITLTATMALLTLYKFYLSHAGTNLLRSFLLASSLVIISVGFSLWNLFTVLFMFWYGRSFAKSAGLALELLFSKARPLLTIVASATIIFLISITAGSLIAMQFPDLATGWMRPVSDLGVLENLRRSLRWSSLLLFGVWLVINNVWFNVVMILVFDYLVKGVKYEESKAGLPVVPIVPAAAPPQVHIPQNIDKHTKLY